MKAQELPLRKCVACNCMKPKNELFRVVRLPEGIQLDPSYKGQGRGAYVCRNLECIALAQKKKSFNRALKCAVSDDVLNSLYMELENGSR
ncbi:RNase P modulator RnpM [Pseudobutyrivibrio xylanivorans]|uniref:YlxR family protein n=1 Tax=Pseudobutyrivibrio xylanivorans TaxID=185007 RepID=A0A5P6VSX9_PSEXY|nr:YlxR family protein [Pseudobutyrivibrio xylanivorans]QFJ55696.1 YlxR family protein [Pseudobutyrivibrio xylanivorans]